MGGQKKSLHKVKNDWYYTCGDIWFPYREYQVHTHIIVQKFFCFENKIILYSARMNGSKVTANTFVMLQNVLFQYCCFELFHKNILQLFLTLIIIINIS